MTDREALLCSIHWRPNDDVPRLVYADWLDEHAAGDRDRAHAEFIRLCCDMSAPRKGRRMPSKAYQWLGKPGRWKTWVDETDYHCAGLNEIAPGFCRLMPNTLEFIRTREKVSYEREGATVTILFTLGRGNIVYKGKPDKLILGREYPIEVQCEFKRGFIRGMTARYMRSLWFIDHDESIFRPRGAHYQIENFEAHLETEYKRLWSALDADYYDAHFPYERAILEYSENLKAAQQCTQSS